MLLQKEIQRYSTSLGESVSHKVLADMQHQAITDLRNRNIAGAIIVPVSYLIGGIATEYSAEHPFIFSFLGLILGIAIILRVLAIIKFSRPAAQYNANLWLPLFFASNLSLGIIWGFFVATAVWFYHDSLSITLLIILLAGISGGSMVSYSIWKTLAYSYLLVILIPPICVELYIGNSVTVPIGTAIACFLIFNLAQTKHWNHNYWSSLANTFLVKQNSRKLQQLNHELEQEIISHKLTAEKIITSQKKLNDLYNSAHDAILIFGLDGKVIDANNTALKLYNITNQEARELNIHQIKRSRINPDVDLEKMWREALAGYSQEFQWQSHRRNQPDLFTAQVNFHRSTWGNDSVIIATIRDITPQVRAQEALLATNRAKSEFLANMSHELRTPLHGIIGYARLGTKRSDTLPRKKANEYFTYILDSGLRLMDLLSNLLDFSKLEVNKMCYNMQNHDLLPAIQDVVTELSPVAQEKNIVFSIHCSNGEIPVFCDIDKIIQVLRNLLHNAVKFSHEGQTISITDHQEQTPEGMRAHQISIINYGIEIPKDELETIFDKFTQSKATMTGAGGTGLGLAISRQIICDHNSTIWAENREDRATVFHFNLPEHNNYNYCQPPS